MEREAPFYFDVHVWFCVPFRVRVCATKNHPKTVSGGIPACIRALGPFWVLPGSSLGGSWGGLGQLLAPLVALLGRVIFFSLRLGRLLGPSWRCLGPSGSLSGPSWGPLGRLLAPLRGPICHIMRIKMRFHTKMKNLALAAARA